MKTIRRRPANPSLKWRAIGQNRQYRVSVRNEDTGHKRIIYEGFRVECRLPADLRLSADQLSFRVESRPADGPNGGYVRSQDFTAVARLGDEEGVEGLDWLASPEIAGAVQYRLQIRDVLSEDVLVDMTGPGRGFLLPAGQLADRTSEWMVRAKVGGAWRRASWTPVTAEMIEAARERSLRLIIVEEEVRIRARADTTQRPAPTQSGLALAPAQSSSLALAVSVTASPMYARAPTPQSVITSEWSDGQGGGATERIAAMLEDRGLHGWFFLDIELGLALDETALPTLARRLTEAGHQVGLYIGAGWLAPANLDIDRRLSRMLAAFQDINHGGSVGVMLGAGPERLEWLDALARAGVTGAIATRDAMLSAPGWQRWRTAPFVVGAGSVVFPTAMFLSTPAHARDRVTRHPFDNRDALAAGSSSEAVQAIARFGREQTLIVAEVSPGLLMDQRVVDDRAEADVWNTTLKLTHPNWLKAGWKRSKSFPVNWGISEIQTELLSGMLAGLARSGLPWADWHTVFDAGQTDGWLAASPAYEPLIEQRRGPRGFRPSAIRRYDNVYRLALGMNA